MKHTILLLFFGIGLFACINTDPQTNTDRPKRNTTAQTQSVGEKTYRLYCTQCHGSNGALGLNGAGDFRESTLNLEERIDVITNGRNTMTPYKDLLSAEEIKAVAGYLDKFKSQE